MERTVYDNLLKWKADPGRKPLIIKGPRQVGKTYILKQFGRQAFPAFHYINFEEDETLSRVFESDLNPGRIIQELSFYVDAPVHPDRDLIIFDEIQACPRALTSLKYFREKMPGTAVCAAGSLLGVQLSREAFPVGKVSFLDMYPLGFEEFLRAMGDGRYVQLLAGLSLGDQIPEMAHTHLWERLKLYFITGGLPEVVKTCASLKDDLYSACKAAREQQSELIKGYLADIAKHSGKQNAMHMERIWKNIPAQLAREQNGSAAKFRFKGVVPGVKNYSRLAGALDWLDAAGLLLKIHIVNKGELPFAAYAAENRFKLCCFDVGILGALSRLAPKTILDYQYGTYKGYFAENFIAQEFRYAGAGELFSWKEKRAEVEFLRESDGRILPIEVKSGWVTQAKSLKVFSEKYPPPFRTVMSAKNLHIDPECHRYPLYLASRFPLGVGK